MVARKGKAKTDDNTKLILKVAKELNKELKLNPEIDVTLSTKELIKEIVDNAYIETGDNFSNDVWYYLIDNKLLTENDNELLTKGDVDVPDNLPSRKSSKAKAKTKTKSAPKTTVKKSASKTKSKAIPKTKTATKKSVSKAKTTASKSTAKTKSAPVKRSREAPEWMQDTIALIKKGKYTRIEILETIVKDYNNLADSTVGALLSNGKQEYRYQQYHLPSVIKINDKKHLHF